MLSGVKQEPDMYIDLLAQRSASDFFKLYDEGTFIGKGGQGKIYLHRKKQPDVSSPGAIHDSFVNLDRFQRRSALVPSDANITASSLRNKSHITDEVFPELVIRKVLDTRNFSNGEVIQERRSLSIVNRVLVKYKGPHPNTVYPFFNHELGEPQLLTFHQPEPRLQIACLMSYCNGGDCYQLYREHSLRRLRVPESFHWHVLMQMSAALAWLHKKPHVVVHRDVKPENILLNFHPAAKFPTCRLADFDLACQYFHETPPVPNGTYCYRPPEQGRHRGVATPMGDIFSLGASVQHMAGFRPPGWLSDADLREWERKERKDKDDLPPRVMQNITRHGYSMHLYVLMMRAMNADPWVRPNAAELCEAAEIGRARAGCEVDEGFEFAVGGGMARLQRPLRAVQR
ncbi:MAG: hypothetical protein M1831_005000 [Alyxoria varia]|nr:MAG: hypothetical protein M1831_005000 [Alyxoria varia]